MANTDQASFQDTILDSINEGVFTITSDWKVRSFNRAAEKITGISRAEAIGKPCCDVFHADICETACALKRTLDTGVPVVDATAHIIGQDGGRVPISVSTALLRDDEGTIIGGVETFRDLTLVEELRKELASRYTFQDIIGRSRQMMRLFELLPQLAESSSTVLIEGESGTGKELVARAIHHLSPRRDRRFVAVNCGALPDTLLESELFGYVAGAFTDARTDKPGRFARADRGTIFLDEIGDVSPAMQVRLLRVLQERCIEPLGAVDPIPVDVRVLAATNKDLRQLVREGVFREDLFYRIRVVHLTLPPLRDRREDIPLLIEHLIEKLNRLQDRDITGVSHDVLTTLMHYEFPGNVRELENILEHAFVLCRGGQIEIHHLPLEFQEENTGSAAVSESGPLSLRSMEALAIVEALRRHHGNRQRAAADLGINPSTLYRKMKAMDIQDPTRG